MEEELTKQEKMKLYQKKWREDNYKRRHDYAVNYYAENKDKYKEYYSINVEHIKARNKAYYQKKKQDKLDLKIKNLLNN